MPVSLPKRTWWMWTMPSLEGPADHDLFHHPNVGLMVRIRASNTNSGAYAPDFTAAGIDPFDGPSASGNYPTYDIYVPGNDSQTEQNCRDAAVSVAKRTIDWIRFYIAIYGYKPMSIFLQNWGRRDKNGVVFKNSIPLCQFVEDALSTYDESTNTNPRHLHTPFTARARHFMRIWGEEYADFLDNNLTTAEKECVLRMHFDLEEGPKENQAIHQTEGWLSAVLDSGAPSADTTRWNNEIIDGTRTGAQLWAADLQDLLDACAETPYGSSGPVLDTSSSNLPFSLIHNAGHYRNSVISDWANKNLKDIVRAFALDDTLLQPMKAVFPSIKTSEWQVANSEYDQADCTYRSRSAFNFPTGSVNYLTDRYKHRAHPFDFHNDVQYLPGVHPISEFSDVYASAGVFTGMGAASSGNLMDALIAHSRETIERIRAANSAKPFLPWINRPGHGRLVTNGLPDNHTNYETYGNNSPNDDLYYITENNWKDLNRMLIGSGTGEQDVREILVWDVITSDVIPNPTSSDYEDSWDTLLDCIDDVVSYP